MKLAPSRSHKRSSEEQAPAAQTRPQTDPPRATSAGTPSAPAARRKREFALRPALREDIPAVIALDRRITALAKPAHWLELYERHKKAGPPSGIFLVATAPGAGGRLLGFIVGEIRAWEFGSAPCGWVYALSVDPDSRLVGVGEALFESIAAQFRKVGVNKMRTMVARDNRLSMMFFRSEGMMAGPYIQLEKDLG
jgi:GNAT superfamily N-acetyltransferase